MTITIQTSHIQVDATAGIDVLPELAGVIEKFAVTETSEDKFVECIVSVTILLPDGKAFTESFPTRVKAQEIIERFTPEFPAETKKPSLITEDGDDAIQSQDH